MLEREASTKTARKGEGPRAGRVSIPNSDRLEEIQRELMYILDDGRDDESREEPGARFLFHLDSILDNSLVDALDTLERHYVYNPPLGTLDKFDIERIWPARDLITMLREYHAARLREMAKGLLRRQDN